MGSAAPHYMLVLGGLPGGTGGEEPGKAFGLPVMKLPASRVSEAISRICQLYLAEGLTAEPLHAGSFGRFVRRIGRPGFKDLLADLAQLPPFEEAPHLYREPGSDVDFNIAVGKGECAGEVVDGVDLLLAAADREADTALELLEGDGTIDRIAAAAQDAMLQAARALLEVDGVFEQRRELVLEHFRAHFYDTGRIFEGIGHYFIEALGETQDALADRDRLRRLVVEAGLFVEEAHSLTMRLRGLAAFPRATRAVKQQLGDPGKALTGRGSWS